MPDEIKNNEEVDLSHFYERKAEVYEQDLDMAKKQAIQKATFRKRKTLFILILIVMILIIVELVLLFISTSAKQEPKHSAPPGYKFVNPKNGIPHYELSK